MASLPKFPIGRFGYRFDPVGEFCRLDLNGRTYLGEILEAWRDEVTGCVLVTALHFNGDPWDTGAVALSALDWIRQDSEAS